MSGQIVEDGLNELEAFEQEQAATPEEILPDKYRNKTALELAKMHQEAEKLIGRHAQEVGEIRKLADQLIKEKLETKREAEPPKPTEEPLSDVDFFADPVKAVNRAVESHPAVLQAKMASVEMQKKLSLDRLTSVHPDYQEVLKDPGFRDWVGNSRIRQTLYAQADRHFDVEAAHELLSNYKELRVKRAEVVTEGASQLRESTEKALKAVSVPSGGSGESSKKIYRRADLINLQIRDPDRYMQMQDEIMSAYQDGRVR